MKYTKQQQQQKSKDERCLSSCNIPVTKLLYSLGNNLFVQLPPSPLHLTPSSSPLPHFLEKGGKFSIMQKSEMSTNIEYVENVLTLFLSKIVSSLASSAQDRLDIMNLNKSNEKTMNLHVILLFFYFFLVHSTCT